MATIITIYEQEKQQVVSARELYDFLGFHKSNWKRWSEVNIVNNSFVFEELDWWGFVLKTNGNESMDYWITLDFAKRLAMQTRSEKGEAIRRYFIDCEKKLQQVKDAVNDFDLLSIEQVLYIINLVQCFKFITNQKAAEAYSKHEYVKAKTKIDGITIEFASRLFNKYRTEALDINENDLKERLLRFFDGDARYKEPKQRRDMIYLLGKFGLIKIAVFDFLSGSQKPSKVALKIGELAEKIAEKMNVELRQENIPSLFDEHEELDYNIQNRINPYLPNKGNKIDKPI